jgi:hypothetical protein
VGAALLIDPLTELLFEVSHDELGDPRIERQAQ